MKTLNIDTAKLLVNRYRSITIAEIEDTTTKIALPLSYKTNVKEYGKTIMYLLTGFGKYCVLCGKAHELFIKSNSFNGFRGYSKCIYCIYSKNVKYLSPKCMYGKNAKSYNRIACAKTAKELHKAIRLRANHIEKLIKKIENGQLD